MVKVARAAEAKVSPTSVCADSINTPLLGKKKISGRAGLAFSLGMTEKSPVMRAVAAIVLLVSGITADAETAETIFISGNVYTVNEKQPSAQAIAVHRDRIILVGSNADAERFRADKTRIVDLEGKTITPRFTDSHCPLF